MFRYLKPPKVYPYANRLIVTADYEHEGVTYKRKSFSIKGDGLAELLGIPSTEERERKAIELECLCWCASHRGHDCEGQRGRCVNSACQPSSSNGLA